MSVRAVFGLQWGDEGKGKIIDYLSSEADLVVRSQGGPNAGHTVVVKGEQAVFHLLPCGILHPQTTCVIASGVVVDPFTLEEELDYLDSRGISWEGRVILSHAAHLILPYHRAMDSALDRRRGELAIGTTGRGIGPAYADKISRVGLRMVDLLHADRFRQRLGANLKEKLELLRWLGESVELEEESLAERYLAFGRRMAKAVTDTARFLNQAIDDKKQVLFEGAQGVMLDIDHGTYPFVTSSNPGIGGVSTGCGVAGARIERVMGVTKAYATRVGNGPFPTELSPAEAKAMRDLGNEFGATTGRPRRCGWLDAVLLRHGIVLNQAATMAVTKLDVLDSFDELKIATAYRVDGETLDSPPPEPWIFDRVEPVYETIPGWKEDTSSCRKWEDLPRATRAYLDRIEELGGAEVEMVSVGSEREQTLAR